MTFTLDAAAVVQLLVSPVLPVLVGLVTTRVTSASLKAWLLAGLSLVTSLAVELSRSLSAGETYDVGTGLLAALPTFIIAVATHYGFWKATGVTDTVQSVGVTPKHRAE